MVHDRHPLTELVRFLHVVSREEDRLALLMESPKDLPKRQTPLRIDPRGWLVQEKHLWPVDQRPPYEQTLLHATRKLVDEVACAVLQADQVEDAVGFVAGHAAAQPEVSAVVVQVLPAGQTPVKRVVLGHHADHSLDLNGVIPNVEPGDYRCAAGGDNPRREHADGCCLACPVWPQQPEELAVPYLEVKPVDGQCVRGEALDEVVCLDGGRRGLMLLRWPRGAL